jgi:hypothetical protein
MVSYRDGRATLGNPAWLLDADRTPGIKGGMLFRVAEFEGPLGRKKVGT